MGAVSEIIVNVLLASWDVLLESSLFILFGFFVAGLLKGFIPDNFIHKHLGKGKAAGIFKASLFGIPIPLCSCGVIPAAAGLREQGASKGAVTSFMISTPETGVDSIAVTYALLDPIMTVVRPVAAFFTASVTGILVNLLDKEPLFGGKNGNQFRGFSSLPPASTSCSSGGCGCTHKMTVSPSSIAGQGEGSGAIDKIDSEQVRQSSQLSQFSQFGGQSTEQGSCECASSDQGSLKKSWREKITKGMAFAFGDLLNDIGPWLLVGIMLAGIITVYISPQFIEVYLGDGVLSMLIMIALATPLYVCATASTPIAAALALKGVSPGAALVFLLAGPATNMATITVVSRLLGRKTALIYVGSIMVCSLILGLLVNWLYIQLGMTISGWVQAVGHGEHGIVYMAAALVLILLVVRPWFSKAFGMGVIHTHSCHGGTCGCAHK